MEAQEITALGREAFAREIRPARAPHKWNRFPVFGFDTEYDSRTGALVSWQIASEDGSSFYAASKTPLTLAALSAATAKARGRRHDCVLVVYFSLAELQHLPVVVDGSRLREFARGSLDVTLTGEDGVRFHVFDVMRFFDKESLAKAAESFGLKKLTWSRDRVSAKDARDPAFVRYALRDAEITREIFLRLQAAYRDGGVEILRSKTPASSAAFAFRLHWLRESPGVPDARVRGLALRSCWGGRAEAFARRRGLHLREYDLDSAYPSACVRLGRFPRAQDWHPLTTTKQLDAWVGGFARVRFRFPDSERYPCLPVCAKGSLVYPLAGESYCSLDELKLALELGADIDLLDGFVYRDGTTAMAEMMKDHKRRRKDAVGAMKVALKLSMNSLIGKTIQHRTRPGAADIESLARELGVPLSDLAELDAHELEALGLRCGFRIGGLWMPEWNGLVTGHVRAQISRLARDTQAVYCATDAVWTEKVLRPVPDGLSLKREGLSVVARTRLGAIWPDHVVHHAWSNRGAARAALKKDRPKRSRFRYRFRRPLHFAQALREGKPVGTWIVERRFGSLAFDGKRELLKDGSTRPWPTVTHYLAARAAHHDHNGSSAPSAS